MLVDTSVWIDHFRAGDDRLARLLEQGQVLCHPFVIAEIALGGGSLDAEPLASMSALAQLVPSSHEAVMAFIARFELGGAGVGYVDAHLLASVFAATDPTRLWTRDRRLARIARRLDLQAPTD